MKKLIPILFVVFVGIAIWKKSPGIRSKANEAINNYAGWTDEARESDPVGFIEYAEGQLKDQLEVYGQSKVKLQVALDKNKIELEKAEQLVALADKLLPEFKQAFQQAEGTNAYPVALLNKNYTREALVEQVEQALNDKATQASVIPAYQQVVDKAGAKLKAIDQRVADIESKLVQLKAQKEVVKIDALTAESDELLGKVYDLLGDNSKVIQEMGDDPVRDLTSLMAAAENAGAEGDEPKAMTVSNSEALDFLNN